jgi:hypothetical protein
MNMGDNAGKSHAEIRVVYSGVQAPVVTPTAPTK